MQLAWYRALVQRANDALDCGSDVVTRVGSGESAASVARGAVLIYIYIQTIHPLHTHTYLHAT